MKSGWMSEGESECMSEEDSLMNDGSVKDRRMSVGKG